MKSTSFIFFVLITVLWAFLFVIKSGAQDQITEDEVLVDIIYAYSERAYNSYIYDVNLDSAEIYLLKALELQYSSTNYYIDERVAINHVTLASVYRKIYNHAKALEHLNQAENILNNTDPNNVLFGSIYHNKGNIYRTRSDLYRTKEYYEYALNFYIKNNYQESEYFSFVYSNYINLLFELEEYDGSMNLKHKSGPYLHQVHLLMKRFKNLNH